MMKKALKILLFIIIGNFMSVNLNAQEKLSEIHYIQNNEPEAYRNILYFTNKIRYEEYSKEWYTVLKFQAHAYFQVRFLLDNNFSTNNDRLKELLRKALMDSMTLRDEGGVYTNYLIAIDMFQSQTGIIVDEL